jgi:hypothetical protein
MLTCIRESSHAETIIRIANWAARKHEIVQGCSAWGTGVLFCKCQTFSKLELYIQNYHR